MILTNEQVSRIMAEWVNDEGPAGHDIEELVTSHELLRTDLSHTDAVWKLENARLEHERDVLLTTMHEIAHWEGGPEVLMSFDCPADAAIARISLAKIGITGPPK